MNELNREELTKEEIPDVPDWAKDAIIYQIFPDSFATSRKSIGGEGKEEIYEGTVVKSRYGGTMNGITDNLDYLLKLGINCICINPLFAAGEYHKYDPIDYYHIDPCFGTDEDFRFMIDMCHNCSIKVIIDGVFNQCGWNFFASRDFIEHGKDSRYKDWFARFDFSAKLSGNKEDIMNHDYLNDMKLLPKLNTSNPEVIEYFCKVCSYWLSEYDIDGWRLEAASELNDDFLREFCKAAKKVKSDCFLVGGDCIENITISNHIDSTMNYDFQKNCREFFASGHFDSFEFDERVKKMSQDCFKNILYGQINPLDSPDLMRFLSLCGEELPRFKLAVLFQMTFMGLPCIFYGDEQKITGLEEEHYKGPMIWEEEEGEMYAFYRAATYLRRKLMAIRRGEFRTLTANRGSRLYVFERYHEDQHIVIVLNAGKDMEELEIDLHQLQIIWQSGLNESSIDGFGYLIAMRL